MVAVAHGTRSPDGPAVIRALLHRVRLRAPEVHVAEAYVELVDPSLSVALARLDGPVVCVPLLLSRGYHVKHDIPGALAASGLSGCVAAPLGPDHLLGDALADRLRRNSASPDAVVLAAAGTSDLSGRRDVERMATMLSIALGLAVHVAYASTSQPTVTQAVTDLVRSGFANVAVAPYLLAPGLFADQVRAEALASGARYVADVLGAHDALVDLVLLRYREAVEALSVGSEAATH